MIEINNHNKTIEVCKRLLEKHNLSEERIGQEDLLSECVVLCKKSGNGLFDITNGVAKIFEDKNNIQNSQFIVSRAIKVMFIVE